MQKYQLYIDGEQVDAKVDDWIEVENPATKEVYAKVPRSREEDTRRAISGANKAFPKWKDTAIEDRIAYMEKLYEYIKEHEEDIAEALAKELGCTYKKALKGQVRMTYPEIEAYIKAAKEHNPIETMENTEIISEPYGVVACITPWNYPLPQITRKIFPALMAGNTVVLKPSQKTPITAYFIADGAHQIKLPDGVLQLVTGKGSEVGEVLAKSKDVDMISFTGSTKGGSTIAAQAQGTVKKVQLELGGKSPALVLEGADIKLVAKTVLKTVYSNVGQTCSCLSRIVAPRSMKEELEEALIEETKTYNFGNPYDENTDIGPLSSLDQFKKVTSYVAIDKNEATLLYEGKVNDNSGYNFPPVIFTDVDQNSTIAQEEIFGPVLSVIYYDDLDEGIEIANNTVYGLSSAVFGPDNDKNREVALKIQAGDVYINGASGNSNAPFGGYKMSGYGREKGKYGLWEFLQSKAVFIEK